ncbi:MAG: helix-turn-helix transcriptional regulator [Prevotella sp.]|nr:helix-turn-helix transcriptional regulator [Prevotella sp.]
MNQHDIINNISLDNQLIFLLKGKVTLSFANHIDTEISENTFVYLPVEQYYLIKASETSTLFVIHVKEQISFCNRLSIEDLARYIESEDYACTNELYSLEISPEIKSHIKFIQTCIEKDICCSMFYKNKVKELLFLLCIFYSREELCSFFRDALSPDSKFHSEVMRNSHKCKSVAELAQLLNYSVSGFEKHFKRTFGISPYKWMLQNKAEKVYCEIRLKKRNFKEICDEYGFSSISHFTNFCKTFLGTTPSNIRKYGEVATARPEKQISQSIDKVY